jgi:copper homeostasis protein
MSGTDNRPRSAGEPTGGRVTDRTLEVIALSVDDGLRAEEGGATRLEVVRDIHEDGLTPPVDVVEGLLARVRIPLRVMIRPRNAFEVGDAAHREEIARDAAAFAHLPVDIVTGYLVRTPEGTALDVDALRLVTERVPRARITVHRVVERLDVDPTPVLRDWGAVDHVLTSGRGASWAERAQALAEAQEALGPVRVLVGGGVDDAALEALSAYPELRGVHVGRLVREGQSYEAPISPGALAAVWRRWTGSSALPTR